uniref:X8 domain-containing protein n=1 Tax=Brassica oleracea var. oleracea TaxID=109376 RepID=A0A0D3BFH4_BRAOL
MSSKLLTFFFVLSLVAIHHIPVVTCRQWCMAMPNASDEQLQANIDYACSNGVDCTQIQPGGVCYEPNTLYDHASYVMNAYYQSHGRIEDSCRNEQQVASAAAAAAESAAAKRTTTKGIDAAAAADSAAAAGTCVNETNGTNVYVSYVPL